MVQVWRLVPAHRSIFSLAQPPCDLSTRFYTTHRQVLCTIPMHLCTKLGGANYSAKKLSFLRSKFLPYLHNVLLANKIWSKAGIAA
jgi:hypothetical protein